MGERGASNPPPFPLLSPRPPVCGGGPDGCARAASQSRVTTRTPPFPGLHSHRTSDERLLAGARGGRCIPVFGSSRGGPNVKADSLLAELWHAVHSSSARAFCRDETSALPPTHSLALPAASPPRGLGVFFVCFPFACAYC